MSIESSGSVLPSSSPLTPPVLYTDRLIEKNTKFWEDQIIKLAKPSKSSKSNKPLVYISSALAVLVINLVKAVLEPFRALENFFRGLRSLIEVIFSEAEAKKSLQEAKDDLKAELKLAKNSGAPELVKNQMKAQINTLLGILNEVSTTAYRIMAAVGVIVSPIKLVIVPLSILKFIIYIPVNTYEMVGKIGALRPEEEELPKAM